MISKARHLVNRFCGLKEKQNHCSIRRQQHFYKNIADNYDQKYVAANDEHAVALSFLSSCISLWGIQSVLDVGSGTGRALSFIKERHPAIRLVGIEPVAQLRSVGYRNGLNENQLIDGDGTNISFPNGEYDLVCEFGVLHHVRNPEQIVAEMLRVARRGIFISDSNNFGQGTTLKRSFKQFINAIGLWPILNLLKTKGRGYSITEGDGIAYSYSVFNSFTQIQAQCSRIYMQNTSPSSWNLYRTASHVALFALKDCS